MSTPEIMEPSACAWCGIARRGHGRQYADAAGWHEWEQPSQEQILARMKARRLQLAVARVGALPMPVGGERTLDVVEEELTGVNLALWEGVQAYARLRLALASAQRGRRESRSTTSDAVALLEQAVAELRREHAANARLLARIAELEQQAAVVAEFTAKRAEYITAIRNCHPDNGHDYDRWQGHAAARRQLAELLGLPVAWPVEDAVSVAKSAAKLTALLAPSVQLEDPHDGPLAHRYLLSRDLPETGGTR